MDRGQTLLIDGPASISILEGRAEVIGAEFSSTTKFVVRKRRRIPIEAVESVHLVINLGKDATYGKTYERAIPESWLMATELIIQSRKGIALVLGGGDSGKTTLCTYLANKALRKGLKVAIVDGDLGQASIGPPTTISYGMIQTPFVDLFNVRAEESYFIGTTSPGTVTKRVIRGLRNLKDDANKKEAELVIIDTDGWIQGELADIYKINMINAINPDFVIGLQSEDELEFILKSLKTQNVIRLPVSKTVKNRNREDRQFLREQGYSKYLKNSNLRILSLRTLKIEYSHLGSGQIVTVERRSLLEKRLGFPIKYCEENLSSIYIVLDKKFHNFLFSLPKQFNGKNIYVHIDGEENGLLVGLLDDKRKFLGLGTLHKVSFEKGVLQIYTPIKDQISVVQIGQIKVLDGKEIGVVNLTI